MLVRRGCGVFLFACAALTASAPSAYAQQTVNLSVGRFLMPRVDRIETDILLIEHNDLVFDISDFSSTALGGEWLVPIGTLLEIGAGVSFSRRTVSTYHVRVMHMDGSRIPRDLSLRQMPVALTARVLPLRQTYRVQPYIGGGVALINWRFSESGDFVDARGNVFRGEHYTATGTAAGPLLLFGMRVAGETLAFGAESRYQSARGNFGPVFGRVAEPDIDLEGWTLQLTAGVRFGR